MRVKFFGQYLIERGEIEAGQLSDALARNRSHNSTIGDLAVDSGYLSEADTFRINRMQSRVDKPFGEMAVELGLLTVGQVLELTTRQQQHNLRLSDVLGDMGVLSSERLEALWRDFRRDQTPFEAGAIHLPAVLEQCPEACSILDLFPKLCRRLARVRVRMSRGVPVVEVPDLSHHASILIRAERSLDVTIAGDRRFAAQLAGGACGFELSSVREELLMDGMGEFLNILVGSAIGVLQERAVRAQLDPPRFDAIKPEGYLFDVAATAGRGLLLLNPS
jgi:hypothetical protein